MHNFQLVQRVSCGKIKLFKSYLMISINLNIILKHVSDYFLDMQIWFCCIIKVWDKKSLTVYHTRLLSFGLSDCDSSQNEMSFHVCAFYKLCVYSIVLWHSYLFLRPLFLPLRNILQNLSKSISLAKLNCICVQSNIEK